MSKEGIIKEIQDDSGNIFTLKQEIGSGAQGTVYLAHYQSKESELVAVKHQQLDSSDPDRYKSIQREIACLKKLDRLFGVKEDGDNIYIVMPYYSGESLRTVMYELGSSSGSISGKALLSKAQKDLIAYGLLREAFTIQRAGIVYADYKPEHILVNFEEKKVRLVDMGQSFVLGSQENPHDTLQASGLIYMPPECFDPNVIATENSFGTDGYIFGLIIAALYSDVCFELAVSDIKFNSNINYGCLVREKLSDLLGEHVKYKDEMEIPEDLFRIIRHLTQIEPSKRPEYLPLADGVELSSELIELSAARDELLRVEEMLKNINSLKEEQKEKRKKIKEKKKEKEKGKEKGKEKEKTKEKTKEKIKSKAKAVFFNLRKSRNVREMGSDLISEALDTLISSVEYPWLSVDTVARVLTQLQGDIAKMASEGRLSKEQANKCIETLANTKKSFLASSSEISSSSSSSAIELTSRNRP